MNFVSAKIFEIQEANRHFDALRHHRHGKEVHRELRPMPPRAWTQAKKQNRFVLRLAPRCPWWAYVWSVRTPLKVGHEGRAAIGTHRRRIEKPPGTRVVLCLHPTGHYSVLAAAPDPKQQPVLLFTNRPS